MQLPAAATSEWQHAPPSRTGTASIIRPKSAALHAIYATLHRRLWLQTGCTERQRVLVVCAIQVVSMGTRRLT